MPPPKMPTAAQERDLATFKRIMKRESVDGRTKVPAPAVPVLRRMYERGFTPAGVPNSHHISLDGIAAIGGISQRQAVYILTRQKR